MRVKLIGEKAMTWRRRMLMAATGMSLAVAAAVPALASGEPSGSSDFVDPAAFDPLLTSVSSGIGSILPKIVPVVGGLLVIGIVFALVRKYAKPA